MASRKPTGDSMSVSPRLVVVSGDRLLREALSHAVSEQTSSAHATGQELCEEATLSSERSVTIAVVVGSDQFVAAYRSSAAMPAGGPDACAAMSELTRRESEIARLVALGLSNKEIASHLTLEVQTVKNHVHNILAKLRVPSRHHVAGLLHGEFVFAPACDADRASFNAASTST
jgi:DNA-binding NarL/FixJ family response regulator